VHPVFAQAIAWLPGRNDTLLTLFSLLSFLFLIEYLNKKKIISLILQVFFLIVSMLTKETAILLPLLFALYIALQNGEKKGISLKKKIIINKYLIILWGIIIVLTIILRRAVLGDSVGFPLVYTITNFIYNLPAIIQFIGKILLPFHLNTMPVLQDVPFYYGATVLSAVIYFIWKTKNKNYRRIIFGILWLLIFLAPAILRTSDNIETLFLEHRLYFPMIGFMIICLETDLIKNLDFNKAKTKFIFSLVIAFFFVLAWIHREDYKDPYHFWKSAAEGSPHSSAALRGLGTYYVMNGKPDLAEKEFIECLKINPDIIEASNNLGRIYLNRGQDSIAEKFFLHEIDINPNSAMAYYNLGVVRIDQNKLPEATELISKSLSIDSNNVDAMNDLSAILAAQEKYEDALKLCISVLEKEPGYQNAKNNIPKIFILWKNPEKVAYYKKVLELKGIHY
jgi:tetratricopeptide (TPR) repeat protein